MGRKCSVYKCDSNYDKKMKNGTEKQRVPVFGFPADRHECEQWIRALPNCNITPETITNNMGICALHWPSDVPTKKRNRHNVPAVPPTIFSLEIPSSCLPTPPTKPCQTTSALNAARNPDIDQMGDHQQEYAFKSYALHAFYFKITGNTWESSNQ